MSTAAGPRHVVIVSPLAERRKEICALLEQAPADSWQCIEAQTPDECVAAARRAHCVILACSLHDQATGLLARLRAGKDITAIPVIAITRSDSPGAPNELLAEGAADYIGRSWLNADSLARTLESAIQRHALQLAVHEREQRLRLALEASNTGMWEWDLVRDRVSGTPEFYAIVGLSAEDLPDGDSFYRRVHPEDVDRMRDLTDEAIARRLRYDCEYRICTPQGSVRWVADIARAVHDDDGKPVRMIGTLRDVTARKQAEAAAAERQAQLAIEGDVAARLERVSAQRMEAGDFHSLLLGILDVAIAMTGARMARITLHQDELAQMLVQRGDDGAADTASLQRAPLCDRTGQLHGMLVLRPAGASADAKRIVDVLAPQAAELIERKRIQWALERSESEYRSLFEAAGAGRVEIDLASSKFLRVNASYCEMTGRTREELIGTSFVDVTHPEDREGSRHLVQRFASGELTTFNLDKRYLRKDGSFLWANVAVSVIRDAAGRPVRMTATVSDLTDRMAANEALRRSESEYRALFESAGIANVEIDFGTQRVVRANRTFCELLGYSIKELRAVVYQELVHPDDRQRCAQIAPAAAGDGFETELRCIRRDGSARWLHLTATLVPDSQGHPVRMLVSAHDISERKRAETALQASEAHLRAIYDNTQEYMGLLSPDGTLLDTNAASLHFGPLRREDVTGRPFWATAWFTGTPGLPESIRAAVTRAAAGETVRQEIGVLDAAAQMRTFEISFVPVRDAQGNVVNIVPGGHELTERKHAEQALALAHQQLAESYAQLEALTSQAAFALALVDRAFQYIRVNERYAQLSGLPAAGHLGRTVQEVYPGLWPRLEQYYSAALAGERVTGVEFVRPSPTAAGQTQHHLGAYFPVRIGEAVIGVGVVLTEITRQKQAEETLTQADRRKNEFLAMLAHELRNPLAPIRNAVRIMQHGQAAALNLRWAVDVIDRQAHTMARLVDDLMDVSRISRGRIELRHERVELDTVVRAATETSLPIIEQRGQRFDVRMPGDPITLHADPPRLIQVLVNLLNNAAKYTEPGGLITLSVAREGDEAVLSVRDTGIGIAPSQIERAFDMFTQMDGARSQGGLGIGLFLARQLIELHGGRLSGRSEGPGQGSEFIVRLPIGMDFDKHVRRPRDSAGQAGTRMRLRVLVVDDNQDAANSLALLLQMTGNEVRTLFSGNGAVAAAQAFAPQVALLDIGLPGMNGYEVARAIRAEPWGTSMGLVAITGLGQPADREDAHAAGFDHHLVKPVDPSALLDLLSSFAPSPV